MAWARDAHGGVIDAAATTAYTHVAAPGTVAYDPLMGRHAAPHLGVSHDVRQVARGGAYPQHTAQLSQPPAPASLPHADPSDPAFRALFHSIRGRDSHAQNPANLHALPTLPSQRTPAPAPRPDSSFSATSGQSDSDSLAAAAYQPPMSAYAPPPQPPLQAEAASMHGTVVPATCNVPPSSYLSQSLHVQHSPPPQVPRHAPQAYAQGVCVSQVPGGIHQQQQQQSSQHATAHSPPAAAGVCLPRSAYSPVQDGPAPGAALLNAHGVPHMQHMAGGVPSQPLPPPQPTQTTDKSNATMTPSNSFGNLQMAEQRGGVTPGDSGVGMPRCLSLSALGDAPGHACVAPGGGMSRISSIGNMQQLEAAAPSGATPSGMSRSGSVGNLRASRDLSHYTIPSPVKPCDVSYHQQYHLPCSSVEPVALPAHPPPSGRAGTTSPDAVPPAADMVRSTSVGSFAVYDPPHHPHSVLPPQVLHPPHTHGVPAPLQAGPTVTAGLPPRDAGASPTLAPADRTPYTILSLHKQAVAYPPSYYPPRADMAVSGDADASSARTTPTLVEPTQSRHMQRRHSPPAVAPQAYAIPPATQRATIDVGGSTHGASKQHDCSCTAPRPDTAKRVLHDADTNAAAAAGCMFVPLTTAAPPAAAEVARNSPELHVTWGSVHHCRDKGPAIAPVKDALPQIKAASRSRSSSSTPFSSFNSPESAGAADPTPQAQPFVPDVPASAYLPPFPTHGDARALSPAQMQGAQQLARLLTPVGGMSAAAGSRVSSPPAGERQVTDVVPPHAASMEEIRRYMAQQMDPRPQKEMSTTGCQTSGPEASPGSHAADAIDEVRSDTPDSPAAAAADADVPPDNAAAATAPAVAKKRKKRGRKNPSVFVGGFRNSVTERDLRNLFGMSGKIRHVSMKQGFAFLNFTSENAAQSAVERLNGHVHDGKTLAVRIQDAENRRIAQGAKKLGGKVSTAFKKIEDELKARQPQGGDVMQLQPILAP